MDRCTGPLGHPYHGGVGSEIQNPTRNATDSVAEPPQNIARKQREFSIECHLKVAKGAIIGGAARVCAL